jgi:hypothetical protein
VLKLDPLSLRAELELVHNAITPVIDTVIVRPDPPNV